MCVYFQSTPLHLASGYNRTRIVQLLLQHGADVHAKDKGLVCLTITFFTESVHFSVQSLMQKHLCHCHYLVYHSHSDENFLCIIRERQWYSG